MFYYDVHFTTINTSFSGGNHGIIIIQHNQGSLDSGFDSDDYITILKCSQMLFRYLNR